jgi:hypothetical protein
MTASGAERAQAGALEGAVPAERDPGDADGLISWSCAGSVTPEVFSKVAASPAFPQASRALAANMLVVAAADRALDNIFMDAGRYVGVMLAIHLHLAGELTLPRLKQLGERSGYLSAGRARDLLRLLQHLGFAAVQSPASGARAATIWLTDPLMNAWKAHHAAALQAASLVEPGVLLVLSRFEEKAVSDAFAGLHAGSLLAATGAADGPYPFERAFLHRHAGVHVSWMLIAESGEGFPPSTPILVQRGVVARRFGVSPTHIRRMLEAAVAEGMGEVDAGGRFSLTEPARSHVSMLYAAQLAFLLAAAAATYARFTPPSEIRPG